MCGNRICYIYTISLYSIIVSHLCASNHRKKKMVIHVVDCAYVYKLDNKKKKNRCTDT